MTLPLTPDMLRGAYEYLRTTPPFKRWKLPSSERIAFRIVTSETMRGWHEHGADGGHIIAVSRTCNGYTASLLSTVAHEMIHLRQAEAGLPYGHNECFKQLGARVCRYHGFDPKEF